MGSENEIVELEISWCKSLYILISLLNGPSFPVTDNITHKCIFHLQTLITNLLLYQFI